jgi:chitosanase
MSFSSRARAAANAIVSCHETGRPVGNYSALVVLSDGAGISYGTHQATHRAGSLFKICKLYCDLSTSPVSAQLRQFLPLLNNPSPASVNQGAHNETLKSLLRAAGGEQKMRFAQNRVFERNYLDPAALACDGSNFRHAMSLAVIYDSMIQGGYAVCRDRVSGVSGEEAWVRRYVAVRRQWLATHPKPVVRHTTYRMDTFLQLISDNNWELNVPFSAHGAQVTDAAIQFWADAEDTQGDEAAEAINTIHTTNTENIAEDGGAALAGDGPNGSLSNGAGVVEGDVVTVNVNT